MLLSLLVPTCAFLVGLIALAFFAARATLEAEVGDRLRETAAAAAAVMPTGLVARYKPGRDRTYTNLRARLTKVAEQVEARRVFLVTLDGRLLVDTSIDAPPAGELDRDLAQDRVELEQVAAGRAVASVLYTSLDGVRFMRGFAPVLNEGEVVAVLGVEGSAANYVALDDWRDYMAALGLLALGALSLLVVIFSRALTAPLQSLADAAARIGSGELSVPVQVMGGAAEIALLAGTMDEMREALLQRDRELQMMLGGIAHEVRNPLGGMSLFVGLLREDLAERPDELELLVRVEHELGVLERVVEEFLAFARRAPVEKAEVSVAALAAEMEGLVAVPLVLDAAAQGAALWGDAQQLRRLVLNVARNAQQAGATQLKLSWVGGALRLTDDGPGFPAEVASRAFDAFYTTREKGTGLGLALCRKIAEGHGGRLTLLNPGQPGASFELSLP